MNSGVNGEPWQATRSWRGCRGFAASDGPTCSPYRSRLTRTFAATVDADLAGTGEAVLSQDGSAVKAAAAAPPRSRLRREIRSSIRGSENRHSSLPSTDRRERSGPLELLVRDSLSSTCQRHPRGHQAFNGSGLPVRDGELGRGQVADKQLFPCRHRRGREYEDDSAAWPVFSLHDLADPAPDAAWVQIPAATGSLAEDPFPDEHGEPCLAQSLLQDRDVLALLDIPDSCPRSRGPCRRYRCPR